MPEEGITMRPKSHFMQHHEVAEIAATFVRLGVKKIRITGGEPLVRSDADKVIASLSRLNVELAITTNGLLLDRFIDCFKTNGLRSVNVSLDSLDPLTYNSITRRNYFDKVMSNISLLLKNDFHVKLNAVILKGVNDRELVDFVKFTQTRKIHFRFIEFMPFSGNLWRQDKGIKRSEMLDRIYAAFPKKIIRLDDSVNSKDEYFRVDGYAGTFGIISSVTNPFCDTCNRIRLTADGRLRNCLFSSDEADLLSLFRAGEDIVPPILESVLHKKAMRGGSDSIQQLSEASLHQHSRAMHTIGG
jgi:cyclic pyranopterin phosphate synthase